MLSLCAGSASSNRKPRRTARAQGLSTPRNNPGGCHLILHNYTHQPTLLPEYQALPPPPSPRPNMGRGTFPSRRAGETDRSERRPGQNWVGSPSWKESRRGRLNWDPLSILESGRHRPVVQPDHRDVVPVQKLRNIRQYRLEFYQNLM